MWGAKGPLRDDDGRLRRKKNRDKAYLIRMNAEEDREMRWLADRLGTTFTDAMIGSMMERVMHLRKEDEQGNATG